MRPRWGRGGWPSNGWHARRVGARLAAWTRLRGVWVALLGLAGLSWTGGIPPWRAVATVPVYLLAAWLVTASSTLMVNLSATRSGALLHPARFATYALERPGLALRHFRVALVEEAIWRALPVYLLLDLLGLGRPWLLLPAVLFVAVHRREGTLYLWNTLEFVLFSILLTFLFAATRDLALVVALHLVRNVNFVFAFHLAADRASPVREGEQGQRPVGSPA